MKSSSKEETYSVVGAILNRQELETASHTPEMPWWAELEQQMAGGRLEQNKEKLSTQVS